ncbi:SDR family NAD(P)-dependent oxidoreductase [Isoptericola chiayiensis]|uniref:SDR family NAD(P)-dependent oxidoreductase n=1 Tax=Isoptericola chiayiensis TaxID=579446 RepID=A0ABP8YF30_9MICO|nr:SDR family NAD(P)-dependent oxidoreductase [Isoptericola chiayiensis]NOV99911.1 short-subunit dehydrogenase involved in D-alanine esterification of teichoic acids [Isoptericola chiayiensis]
MDITRSTVFIPGATSGIGLALAVALHEQGSTVVVGGRRTDRLAQIAADHPGIDTVPIDITDPASIDDAARTVLGRHPDLDAIVAMAGIMQVEDWHRRESFLASAERTVITNVLGPIRLIGAFVEHLQRRPDATIVTVSSGLAFVPLAATPSYDASKAAIHRLSEALRLQLADTGVDVVEIVPPAVATDLLPGQRDNPIAMPLEEFVSEVVDLLRSQPGAPEVLVERVGFLRHAEAHGTFDEVVATLNASDHHGR